MSKRDMTRRDVLTKAVPAAALMGAGLGALAQQPPGQPVLPAAEAGAPSQEPGQFMQMMARQVYADGKYQLPPLPYDTNALEPHISAQILQIHHDIHHQGYVNGLNDALNKINEIIQSGNYNQANLGGLMHDVSYNGGGHMLHSLYWTTMAPPQDGQSAPNGALAEAINSRYGSFGQFKTFFTQVALTCKDSGWALLIYEAVADGLGVFQVGDHDLNLVAGALPILTLDVWEHAYYLQYQNKRADYVNAWWNVVNWAAVNEMFTFFRQQNHLAENMQT